MGIQWLHSTCFQGSSEWMRLSQFWTLGKRSRDVGHNNHLNRKQLEISDKMPNAGHCGQKLRMVAGKVQVGLWRIRQNFGSGRSDDHNDHNWREMAPHGSQQTGWEGALDLALKSSISEATAMESSMWHPRSPSERDRQWGSQHPKLPVCGCQWDLVQ